MSDFSVARGRPDGRCPQCKDCFHEKYEANKEHILEAAHIRYETKKPEIKAYHAEYYQRHRDQLKERSAEWYAANREEGKAKRKEYARAHPEEALERNRAWRAANLKYSNEYKRERLESDPEKRARQNECNREWAHDNPGRVHEGRLLRESRLKMTDGAFDRAEWDDLLDYYGHRCPACRKHESETPEGKLEQDHVIPLSWVDDPSRNLSPEQIAGLNLISNIQPLCRRCNLKKGTKYIPYRNGAPALNSVVATAQRS
jgi:5-methylcytosine-specific restriction endonuclease McrA